MADDIPGWAVDQALSIMFPNMMPFLTPDGEVVRNVARYIAEHEQPPVDPLLIEAKKYAESWAPEMVTPHPPGRLEALERMALACLKHGIELAKEQNDA